MGTLNRCYVSNRELKQVLPTQLAITHKKPCSCTTFTVMLRFAVPLERGQREMNCIIPEA